MKNMTKKFATVMVAATAVTAVAPALVMQRRLLNTRFQSS